jgi:hypothetical protein
VTSTKVGSAGQCTGARPTVAAAKAVQPTVNGANPAVTGDGAVGQCEGAIWELVPASIPTASCAAKSVPWSVARKNATGPEVNGRPTSQPLIC